MEHMYQTPTDEATSVTRFEPPIEGTCVWFLQMPAYVEWIECHLSSILWISGEPGCGKTTLASFLIDNINQHPLVRGTDCQITYFFFDWSRDDQSDGTSLFFALIHQLLQAEPALALIVKRYGDCLNLSDLCSVFADIVSSPERKVKKLVCVVDALDECETESMTEAISSLASVISACNKSDKDVGWLKLAVTSHSNQHIEEVFSNVPTYQRIRLADYEKPMKQDVETFIRARCVQVMEIMECNDEVSRGIEEELMKRSDNTFLWVGMVLGQLKVNPNARLESFIPTLRSTPNKLYGLYNSTFERLEASDELLRVLSVIVASQRPLTLDEIDAALAVESDDSFARQVQQRRRVNIAQYLYDVCGPFIRIRNLRIVMHKTATNFLLRSADASTSPVGSGMYQREGCLGVAEVNQCLAEICAEYLTLDSVVSDASLSDRRADVGDEGFDNEDDSNVEENSGQTCRKSGRNVSLFDYAAKYWGTHYRLSHAFSSGSTGSCGNHTIFSKAMALCDTSTCTFHDWFQLYWNTISREPKYPDNLTPLMIASHLGLLDLMRELLTDSKGQNKESNHLHVADSEGWTALHWAAWSGHGINNDEAMYLLLQYQNDKSEVSISKKPHDNGSHCNESIQHQQCLPTGSGTSVLDIQDGKGYTALHWAAADNQTGVVKLLLEAGATVDIFDNEKMTPLLVAFEHGFVGPVISYPKDMDEVEDSTESMNVEFLTAYITIAQDKLFGVSDVNFDAEKER
ncbi:hypothetical protein FANTH_13692 [Fusarium anthophilum]|uniref:NACHT domain-containing protein n=1 Tax=Fusarium anthophilum TaxID=48485 RepID=A0A8H4YMG4_9HYPO|nr:hypothetical protein FANTH_13692 [Fusarium anthophilum]